MSRSTPGSTSLLRAFAAGAGALAITAASAVGSAVGDAQSAPRTDAATVAARSTPEASDWSWTLAPGTTLEIEGVNGSIRATRGAGPEVRVHAVKTAGRHGDPDQVKVEVLRHADGITLCVRYPDVPGEKPNRCEPGGHSHMSTRNNDVRVDFTVQLPAGVRLAGHTVNGSIEATGLDSEVEASTVNGGVTVETVREAEGRTVNGDLRARLGRLGTKALDYRTVNGSITLELPAGAGAEISAKSVNGGMESDFPITIRRTGYVGRRMEGTIGSGGPRVELSTVNGSIRVRKSTGKSI